MLRTAEKKENTVLKSRALNVFYLHFALVYVCVFAYPGDLPQPLQHLLCVQLLDRLLSETKNKKERQNETGESSHVSLDFDN